MFHWEGKIAPGFSDKIATHMDVAPTVISIVNGNKTTIGDDINNDMHGVDLSSILFEDSDQVAQLNPCDITSDTLKGHLIVIAC